MENIKTTVDFQIGNNYVFTINRVNDDYCELLDEAGFPCYLQGTNRYKFSKGQQVTCRVMEYKATAKHPRIQLVETDDLVLRDVKVDESLIGRFLKEMEVKWNTKSFINMLLMVDSGNSYENECNKWIQKLIESKCDLISIRRDCFNFIELSGFLKICKPSDREFYQQRLTILIQLMGYYVKAGKIKEAGENSAFIDTMFKKLKISGFVYHPTKNFNIMACLFQMDHNLMENKIDELFGILRQWGLDMWKKEPFRTMLIKVLELYVNGNIWNIDRKVDNRELVSKLIQALSIQFLLIGNKQDLEDIDLRLNISRLCVLSTYAQVRAPQKIINLTLTNLLNSNYSIPNFSLADTGSGMIPLFIDQLANVSDTKVRTINSYIHGKAKLVVSTQGIELYSGSGDQQKGVLPKELSLWGNMQVYVDKKSAKTPIGRKDITIYENLWTDIEQEIFREKNETIKNTRIKKRKHIVGEIVKIIITKKISQGLFECKIVDEIGGEGFISMDQIVPYSVTIQESDFLSEKGERLVFEATIIDTAEDDGFYFSMLNIIRDLVANEGYYSYDDRIICSIGSDQIYNDRVPAVSREGVGISLHGFNNIEDKGFKKGDVVVAVYDGPGTGSFHITCNIIERCENQDFYLPDAFRHLIRYVALPDDDVSTVQEEDIQQNDRILDTTYMQEIIRSIDRMSIIDNEYIKSYNYLGFARILCLMIGWEQQAAYYKGRMDLIAMLHDFAVNDFVDEDKLELLDNANADMFNSNVLLKERYEQLKIVSFLGKPEHQDELLMRYTNSKGIHQTLASLVLGYNIMKSQGMDKQAYDVHNKIKQTLKLKGFESHLTTYGTGVENLTTEYKQSIVYAPGDMNRPNLALQTRNILKVIASFLNTNGGTLYLGVNDCGAGVGLDNDLRYPEFSGDKDKYQRYISDKIANTWGNRVATCVKSISYDPNNDKDVLIVCIDPFEYGVEYEGNWWVRTGSSKRALSKNEFGWYNSHNRQAPKDFSSISDDNLDTSDTTTPSDNITEQPINLSMAALQIKEDNPKPQSSTTAPTEEQVSTSRIRLNNISATEAPFPIAYFKFLPNNNFCRISTYDYDPELLTLAVLDDERNAYLVLGYADGTIAKAPVDELLDKRDYVTYKRNSASKLIFASIGHNDDAIVSVTKEAKSSRRIMVRFDTLNSISECKIADKGARTYNDGMISEVLDIDIVPADKLAVFKNIINLDSRSLGNPYKTLTPSMAKMFAQLGFNY